MAGQAKPSVLQLSTFTKVTSIPREKSYTDLPVTVRVKAPAEMTTTTLHERAPVDVVAVLDVSGSMAWDYGDGTTLENRRLERAKEAMAKAIQSLGRPAAAAAVAVGGALNRLAVVPFSDVVKQVTPLTEMMHKEGQESVKNAVDALKPGGRADYFMPLKIAAKILDERKAAEKDRLALIIFLSDGKDDHFKDTDNIKEKLKQLELKYPIHAFGVTEEGSGGGGNQALQTMADATSGSYTSITQGVDDIMAVAEKLAQLSDKPTSIVAVDVSIHLKSLHPAVSLLRIESSSSSLARLQIADDKQSGEITVGAVSSGEEREFTVYLHVPEGQQGNADGDDGVVSVTTMELLAVGGGYKQSWDDDQEQVALGESVVAVARPPPSTTSSCKELEWIEERVEYWHKVKLDLSAMYDKAEAEAAVVKCQVTEALRQTSMEAVDRAMHHDIYTATLLAIKLRHCGTGSTKSG